MLILTHCSIKKGSHIYGINSSKAANLYVPTTAATNQLHTDLSYRVALKRCRKTNTMTGPPLVLGSV